MADRYRLGVPTGGRTGGSGPTEGGGVGEVGVTSRGQPPGGARELQVGRGLGEE